MERKNLIAQIYGYLVCITAIITFLVSIASIFDAIIDLNDPLYAWGSTDKNLASFENYKVDAMNSIQNESAYIPDDVALEKMYEAAKTEKIKMVEHRAYKTILTSGLMLLISTFLFLLHWFWLKKIRMSKS